jgi:hypothetical protein
VVTCLHQFLQGDLWNMRSIVRRKPAWYEHPRTKTLAEPGANAPGLKAHMVIGQQAWRRTWSLVNKPIRLRTNKVIGDLLWDRIHAPSKPGVQRREPNKATQTLYYCTRQPGTSEMQAT